MAHDDNTIDPMWQAAKMPILGCFLTLGSSLREFVECEYEGEHENKRIDKHNYWVVVERVDGERPDAKTNSNWDTNDRELIFESLCGLCGSVSLEHGTIMLRASMAS